VILQEAEEPSESRVSAEPSGLTRGFVALQHRSFRWLFLSSITSGIGGQLQNTANLWQIFALTGSPVHLGLTGLVRAIPIIFFSLIGGVIADRFDRRKIIIATQASNGIVAITLGILSFTGLVEVWHIYAATFLNATLMSASAPARRAVIASIVPRHHLMNAMALNSSVQQIDRIIAPSLGGILIAVFGLPLTYVVNGSAHFITACALGFISLGPVQARPQGSPLRNLLEGLAFVQQRRIILVLLLTDVVAMLFGSYQVLLPILADRFDVGPAGFGFLSSAAAAGSLIAVTIVMYLGDFPYKGRLIAGAVLAYCGFLVALALAPWFGLALLATAGLGFSDSMQASPRNAMIQLMTPDALRGRVSSFQQMLVAGGPALGQGFMGAAAGVVGAPVALIAGASACALIIVVMLVRIPALRARDVGSVAEPAPVASPVAAG